MKSFVWVLSLLVTALAQPNYKIHHRVIGVPSPSPFSHRATVSLLPDGEAVYEAESLDKALAALSPIVQANENALYQIALERPGDNAQEDWVLSSGKACHLSAGTSDIISLIIDSSGNPFGIDYHILGVPHDGSCSTSSTAVCISITNTTILLKRPSIVPTPIFLEPPPLTPDGRPIVPQPQQTFLQKVSVYNVIPCSQN
ncbi:hypothetical protein BS47DRAFT_1289622 [Hydnum rufescens UP504]|uniref:Uncharacterized protein n=1 Tax=Hydnum rufescens UP504 TaxID=1448309 RepID=A0A9P6B6D1_9AGAM|nr:hypothetical protein BS47DRAFT_1289622 [Hydnum rufescens UP504]